MLIPRTRKNRALDEARGRENVIAAQQASADALKGRAAAGKARGDARRARDNTVNSGLPSVTNRAAAGKARGLARAEASAMQEAKVDTAREDRQTDLLNRANAGAARGRARSTIGADAAETQFKNVQAQREAEKEAIGEKVGFSANTNKEGESLMDLTKDFMTDTLRGRDPQTQSLMNRFAEEGAASETAARGAAGQRAQLQDMSQSAQDLSARLTERDLQGAKQQGIAELARTAGQRADAAAVNLQGIASGEIARDRADVDKGINLAVEAGDFGGAKRLAEEAGFGEVDFGYLQDIQNDNIAAAAKGKLIGHVANNKNSFIGDDGSYDSNKLLADPLMRDEFAKIWEAERGGVTGEEWDPEANPDQMAWAKTYADNSLITDAEDASNSWLASRDSFYTSPEFLGMNEDAQNAIRENDQKIANIIGSGLEVDVDESTGRVVTRDAITGETLAQTATTIDTSTGGQYTETDDGFDYVSPEGEVWSGDVGIDGALTLVDNNDDSIEFTNVDGKWVSDDEFEVKTHPSDWMQDNLNNAFDRPGVDSTDSKSVSVAYDEGTGIARKGGRGGEAFYRKGEDGSWFEVSEVGSTGEFEPVTRGSNSLDDLIGDKEAVKNMTKAPKPDSIAQEIRGVFDEGGVPEGLETGDYFVDAASGTVNVKTKSGSTTAPLGGLNENQLKNFIAQENLYDDNNPSMVTGVAEALTSGNKWEDYSTVSNMIQNNPNLLDEIDKTAPGLSTVGSGKSKGDSRKEFEQEAGQIINKDGNAYIIDKKENFTQERTGKDRLLQRLVVTDIKTGDKYKIWTTYGHGVGGPELLPE
jgi:hypothetical protein